MAHKLYRIRNVYLHFFFCHPSANSHLVEATTEEDDDDESTKNQPSKKYVRKCAQYGAAFEASGKMLPLSVSLHSGQLLIIARERLFLMI